METGASGVAGQNAAWLVDLECGHVSESATHPNLRMAASLVMTLEEFKWDIAGFGSVDIREVCKVFNLKCLSLKWLTKWNDKWRNHEQYALLILCRLTVSVWFFVRPSVCLAIRPFEALGQWKQPKPRSSPVGFFDPHWVFFGRSIYLSV